jgi:prepilin peptidase CpaA
MRGAVLYGLELLFLFCVIYAMISDYRRLRIPNAICILLAAGFLPYALLAGPAIPLLAHLGIAAAVFLILFACFAFGWLGGGDVKLAGAIMLWAGPAQGANFVVLFALFGGAFALLLLSLRVALAHYPVIASAPGLGKISGWAQTGLCPYALPIGAAALCVAPAIFARVS